MVSLFDPISVALETVKTIEGVGCHKPDPCRFKVREPPNPGGPAKIIAFQRGHNIHKWNNFRPKTIAKSSMTLTGSRHRSYQSSVRLGLKHSAVSAVTGIDLHSDLGVEKDEEAAIPEVATSQDEMESRQEDDAMAVAESLGLRRPSMDYDDDIEDEEDEEEAKRIANFSPNQMRYWRACIKFKCRVSRKALHNMDNFELILKMMKMTDLEFKALTSAMVGNDFIMRLDLTEMRLSDQQVVYLTDFFTEESAVTDLILAENMLKGRILESFFSLMIQKDCITYLDISGNDLRDKDVPMLVNYVKVSGRLYYLYMRNNNFTEASGDAFGKMIAENSSIADLDISHNRIRAVGAEKFLKGMMKNTSIERLDFSWNGLGKEGIKAVANVLKKNATLVALNLSGNRISGSQLEQLYPSLKKNGRLQYLVLSHNPLLMSDIAGFLKELYKWAASGLQRLDFGSYQTLETDIIPLIDLLFWEKNIDVRYGSTLTYSAKIQTNEEVVSRFRDDPLALVTKLKPAERMRLVKYFGEIDLEQAIESGQEEIGTESFLYKMRNNKVTYKDLANRVKKAGNNPNEVIRTALEIAELTDPSVPLVPRYSLLPDVQRFTTSEPLRRANRPKDSIMKWFEGGIPSAIQQAKSNKSVFIVFIGGEDEKSGEMESYLHKEDVTKECEENRCVAVKLAANSNDCKFFSQIYPVVVIPSTFFIGDTGVPLEVIGECKSHEDFLAKVRNAISLQNKGPAPGGAQAQSTSQQVPQPQQQPQQSAAAEVPAATSQDEDVGAVAGASGTGSGDDGAEDKADDSLTLEDKVERAKQLVEQKRQEKAQKEAEEARRKEMERRTIGQGVQKLREQQKEQELLEAKMELKKDREEDKRARQRVKDEIERDRAEKAARFSKEKDERARVAEENRKKKLLEQQAAAQEQAMRSDIARIQFRLPDGSSVTQQFPATDTFASVNQFITQHMGSPVSLSMTFPRRTFTTEDHAMTLQELQLAPSAVILVIPGGVSTSAVRSSSGILSVSGITNFIFAPFLFVWNLLASIFGFAGSSSSGAGRNSRSQTSSAPATLGGDRNRGGAYKRPASTSRQEGSVRRFRNAQDDEDDNDRSTWNGNSTQQM